MSGPGAGEHITDYERAVCYYTLPQVTHPLTYALIIAYAVCLFEALGAVIIGLLGGYPAYAAAGTIALAALIVFGMIVFTVRAFLNDLRARRALAATAGAPDAPEHVVESGEELPNPFAAHVLLQRVAGAPHDIWQVNGPQRQSAYRIEAKPRERRWQIDTVGNGAYCDVRAESRVPSFQFGSGLPGKLALYRAGERIGEIRYRLTLRRPEVRVRSGARSFVISNDGILEGDRLRGRVYELRNARYLDIERDALCEGVLAYFAVRQ